MGKELKVTLVRSMIGRPEKHRKILRGMGVTRMGRTVKLEDTPAVRGMIRKVIHMIKTEEIS